MAYVQIIGYDNVGTIGVNDSFIEIITDGYKPEDIVFHIMRIDCREGERIFLGYEFGFFYRIPESDSIGEIITSYVSDDVISGIDWHRLPQVLFEMWLMPYLITIRNAHQKN